MITGVHEDAPPLATRAAFPGSRVVRRFVTGAGADKTLKVGDDLVRKVETQIGPALVAGYRVIVSFKLRPADVAAGRWDAKLSALGARLAGLDVIVVPWHEPEDNHTAAVFVPYFARIRGLLKAQAPGLVVAYCAMAYQWVLRGGRSINRTRDAQAWAAIEADLYLVDVYSGQTFDADLILPEHPGFVRWYAEVIAAHPGRTWGVAERGILANPGRPATFARELDWLLADPVGKSCAVYVVWATGGTEGNPGWLLDVDSRATVAELVRRLWLPEGYERGPLDGVLVHAQTGALVAGDRVGMWDALMAQIGGNL